MTVSLLTNSIGNAATSIALLSGSTASGFALNDLISGPRNYYWRATQQDANTSTIVYYEVAASTAIDFAILAGAHKLLTENGIRVRIGSNNDAGGTLSTIEDVNPLTAASLLGIKSQDYIITFASTNVRRAGVTLTTVGEVTGDTVSPEDERRVVARELPEADSTIDQSDRSIVAVEYPISSVDTSAQEAVMFSKLMFGAAFDFGVNPQAGPTLKKIRAKVRPLRGFGLYATEAEFKLTWRNITKAKMQAFEALPLHWPLFIYDSDASIIKHKLEHVIIAQPWNRVRRGANLFDITTNFLRLRHYED